MSPVTPSGLIMAGSGPFVSTAVPPAFVKVAGSHNNSVASTTITVPIPTRVTAGHTLIVPVFFNGTGAVAATLTDSSSNTYTQDAKLRGTTSSSFLFHAHITTAISAGGHVTVTFTSNSDLHSKAVAVDYEGITQTSPLGATFTHVSNAQSSSSYAPATFTASAGVTVAFGCSGVTVAALAITSGATTPKFTKGFTYPGATGPFVYGDLVSTTAHALTTKPKFTWTSTTTTRDILFIGASFKKA